VNIGTSRTKTSIYLPREKSLLNGLLGAGFDLHPILAEVYLKKAQEHVEGIDSQIKVTGQVPLVPPEEALVIDQPGRGLMEVCLLTDRARTTLRWWTLSTLTTSPMRGRKDVSKEKS
jgi:hypothetical protein